MIAHFRLASHTLEMSEVTPMPYEKCYPAAGGKSAAIAGYALIAVGIILLFCCIPFWIWLALIGVGLIAAGLFLLKLSRAWR
ncbi:MAG: hypothetical protein PHI98_04540 [Eubacteriales bacterium]|nr:hypothetical protein [Eubacteriales bacterium]